MDHLKGMFVCSPLVRCAWVVELFVGILVLCVAYFALRRYLKKAKFTFFSSLFNFKLDGEKTLLPACKVLFWTIGIYYVIRVLSQQLYLTDLLGKIRPFRNALIVLCLFWMAYRVQQDFCRVKGARIKGIAFTFNKIAAVSLVIITGLVLLRIFNVDIMPLLAFGGIGAAVLGFAAKDVMGSFVSGIMLSITRPFSLYETILLPDRNLEGKVEEMGWCLTVVRDKDQRLAYLPNSLFSQVLVINLSRRSGRRILETFRLRRKDKDKIDLIIGILKDVFSRDARIDQNMPILVFVDALGEYSIELQLDIYALATTLKEYTATKDYVLRKVLTVIHETGADLAYPVALHQN